MNFINIFKEKEEDLKKLNNKYIYIYPIKKRKKKQKHTRYTNGRQRMAN